MGQDRSIIGLNLTRSARSQQGFERHEPEPVQRADEGLVGADVDGVRSLTVPDLERPLLEFAD
jgi:hypothetical protein